MFEANNSNVRKSVKSRIVSRSRADGSSTKPIERENVVLVGIYRTTGTMLNDQMFFKSNTYYTVKPVKVFF